MSSSSKLLASLQYRKSVTSELQTSTQIIKHVDVTIVSHNAHNLLHTQKYTSPSTKISRFHFKRASFSTIDDGARKLFVPT